jgi:hypothetical protein
MALVNGFARIKIIASRAKNNRYLNNYSILLYGIKKYTGKNMVGKIRGKNNRNFLVFLTKTFYIAILR